MNFDLTSACREVQDFCVVHQSMFDEEDGRCNVVLEALRAGELSADAIAPAHVGHARTERAGPSWAERGFLRVAVVTPSLAVADPATNATAIVEAAQEAAAQGAALILFPELALSGYTCADLFYQSSLRAGCLRGLETIAAACASLGSALVVGLPFELAGRLYNVAAVIVGGRVVGLVPKTYLPSSGEFYEERWFTSSRQATANTVSLAGREVPFGTDLLFVPTGLPQATFGIEICEDLWAPSPPSGGLAVAGATILLNPSASDELLGKAAYRRELVASQSARCLAAYLYAAAGPGESSTDVVYGGDSLIYENGTLLAAAERFHFETQTAIADLDLERLRGERLRSSSFSASPAGTYRSISFDLPAAALDHADLRRAVSPTPFVPGLEADRAASCAEIFAITATALARRLRHTGSERITIGLSGGLDSTLALLIAVKAFETLRLPLNGIAAVSMPGLGTSSRTRQNAAQLAAALEVDFREIPISEAVRRHFSDIGHDPGRRDTTYQNAQARERTQVLMDLANQIGGFAVGTGDLSEIALGWSTYNGDQMSNYHVNAGIPKTLVRYLVAWAADELFVGRTSAILRDIAATPISPELLPAQSGSPMQETESLIGPYRLHDFFLYYAIRHSFGPRRVAFLAAVAFAGEYEASTIRRWLRVFYTRFFAAQFKRSAMPDGPKVGTVALSPRGDWRMPSDARATLWLAELDELEAELAAASR